MFGGAPVEESAEPAVPQGPTPQSIVEGRLFIGAPAGGFLTAAQLCHGIRDVAESEIPALVQELNTHYERDAAPYAIESAAEVQKSDRSAARQSGAGQSSAIAIATWESRLMTHLGRNKRYPADARARGETGTAVVTFSLDRSGKVLSASLRKPSGHRDLDAEALDLVRRASPLPAPPPGAPLTITAPVRFSIK
jgi:protein TonB